MKLRPPPKKKIKAKSSYFLCKGTVSCEELRDKENLTLGASVSKEF